MMPADPQARAVRAKRMLCSSVLVAEALVVLFAVLVALRLTDVPDTVLWAGGGVIALVCFLLCGMLRAPWAYAAGGAVQVALVASGLLVPAMFVIGALFAGLWVTCLVLVRRIAQSAPFPAPPA